MPYTGFEAGPFLTSVFYILLALWAASVAYVLVIKKGAVFGLVLRRKAGTIVDESVLPHAEYQSRTHTPQFFEETPLMASAAVAGAPANLPIGMHGYATAYDDTPVATEEEEAQIAGVADSHLEERAHRHNLILSSDALHIITDNATSEDEEAVLLDEVIARARVTYPREDGWIALNAERLLALF